MAIRWLRNKLMVEINKMVEEHVNGRNQQDGDSDVEEPVNGRNQQDG